MRVKEKSEKAGFKFNIQKSKIMAPGPITSWQIEGEKVETVPLFLAVKIRFKIFIVIKVIHIYFQNVGKF